MAPYVWSKIDWNMVFKILIGMTIGSPGWDIFTQISFS